MQLNVLVLLLFILYYATSLLYPSNDATESQRLVPQLSMVGIAFVAIFVTVKNYRWLKSFPLFRPFLLLCLIQVPYIFILNGDASLFQNFITYLKYNLAIFAIFLWFYLLDENECIAHRNILIVFFIQVAYAFSFLYNDLHTTSAESQIFDSNAGFILVSCVPMTLLLPQKRLRVYMCLLLLMGCIMSGQRSAGVAAVVAAPFCFRYLKGNIKQNDWIILIVLGLIVGLPLLSKAYDNLMLRMAIDEAHGSIGSGRSVFWLITWEQFWSKGIWHIILGNGYGSLQITLKELFGIPISSHNGWLDYLYMFGLMGEIVYVWCYIVIFKCNGEFNKALPDYRNFLLIIGILFVVRSSTSHGFWDIGVIPLGMSMAVICHKYGLNACVD